MKSESSSGNHRENTELYNNCPSGSLPLTAGHLRQSDVNGRYTCTAVRKTRCINYRMNGKTNNKHIQLQQTSLWRWWQEYPQRITCQFVFEYWNSMEFRLMCIVQCNSLHVKNLYSVHTSTDVQIGKWIKTQKPQMKTKIFNQQTYKKIESLPALFSMRTAMKQQQQHKTQSRHSASWNAQLQLMLLLRTYAVFAHHPPIESRRIRNK